MKTVWMSCTLAFGLAWTTPAWSESSTGANSPHPPGRQVVAIPASTLPAQEKIPVIDFFRRPQVGQATLSPSGRYLAVQFMAKSGRQKLAVYDLDTGTDKVVAGFNDVDIHSVYWLGENRLLFHTIDFINKPWHWKSDVQQRLIVDRDGSNMQRACWGAILHLFGDDGAYMVTARETGTGQSLFRLDMHDCAETPLTGLRPAYIYSWLLDESGDLIGASSARKDVERFYQYDKTNDKWIVVSGGDPYTGDALQPIAYRFGQMYVHTPTTMPREMSGVFRYDLEKRKLEDQPFLRIDGFDFFGTFVFDHPSKSLIGVHHLTDAWSTTWMDAGMADIQKQVDDAMPGLSNLVSCGRACLGRKRYLVGSSSDRHPMQYSLFDTTTGRLQLVGRSRPWIDPARMGRRDFFRIAARDGLSLPVYVTTPAGWKSGDAARPAVVLVHGGPWERGSNWIWHAEAQFLASRGYVVLQPEFRGSIGFGFNHFKAGWKQWGLAMQDDIADATKWAIGAGYVDPQRICIAGEGYGGYSALMGLVRDPALFRCAVSAFGPTDIDDMYGFGWSSASVSYLRYGMPKLVADRTADAEQIKATSPYRLASKITQPVLLAYGAEDREVPIEHGEQMRDALRKHNPNVEWVRYGYEGHGLFLLENQVDFWTRVENFLASHIGAGNTPPAAAAQSPN